MVTERWHLQDVARGSSKSGRILGQELDGLATFAHFSTFYTSGCTCGGSTLGGDGQAVTESSAPAPHPALRPYFWLGAADSIASSVCDIFVSGGGICSGLRRGNICIGPWWRWAGVTLGSSRGHHLVEPANL